MLAAVWAKKHPASLHSTEFPSPFAGSESGQKDGNLNSRRTKTSKNVEKEKQG